MHGIPQNIIDRIQKLINLKEGAEAVNSLAEAENASARLQEMLLKYNLSIEDVKKSKVEQKAEIEDKWVPIYADKRESFWIPKLYWAIARNNLCYASFSERAVWIVGEKHNVELVLYIAEQMVNKIRIAEKFSWKNYDKENRNNPVAEKRGTYRRGFFEGAALGIDQRLQREREEMEAEANKMALMIISKEKVVNDYMEEKYWAPAKQRRKEALESEDNTNTKKKSRKIKIRKGPRELSSNDGYKNGYDSGLAMNINKGLN